MNEYRIVTCTVEGRRYYWNGDKWVPGRASAVRYDASDARYVADTVPANGPIAVVRVTRKSRRAGKLASLTRGLPDLEQRVLCRVAERLTAGLKQYGPFKRGDGRDMREEALQEVLDAQVYCAMALEQLGDNHE
jgi:hypothetical protein